MKHPMQAMIDTLSEAMAGTRKDYHLTWGKLLKALRKAKNENAHVVFEDGTRPLGFISYRGYYCDIAIEFGHREDPITVAQLYELMLGLRGTALEGYKGGLYDITNDRVLWKDNYSYSEGHAVMGAHEEGETFTLLTKKVDP